jgi:hypothetical protein
MDDAKLECNLMDPDLSNLPDLCRLIDDASKSFQGRNKIVNYLTNSEFLDKLIKVFNDCEDLENIGDLYILGDIMRMISKT